MIYIFNSIVGYIFRVLSKIAILTSTLSKSNLILLTEPFHKLEKNKLVLPKTLIDSVIVIEDKRFYIHLGVDTHSIFRALYNSIFYKKLEGASTIEQQFVRNITGNKEITLSRKFQEILYAVFVCSKFSKTQIMLAYLTTYTINNKYGVLQFCLDENYNINNLSESEAAEIAARFKFPTLKFSNYLRYLKRVRTIEIKLRELYGTKS